MKRIPKAIGLGFGIALSSGAMFSPAEAQQTHESTQTSSTHFERDTTGRDYFGALGFLALGAAVILPATWKLGKVAHEKFFDTESDPYLMSEALSDDPLPKYAVMSEELRLVSRDYHEMKQMSMVEFSAEWIAFQAARTEEL